MAAQPEIHNWTVDGLTLSVNVTKKTFELIFKHAEPASTHTQSGFVLETQKNKTYKLTVDYDDVTQFFPADPVNDKHHGKATPPVHQKHPHGHKASASASPEPESASPESSTSPEPAAEPAHDKQDKRHHDANHGKGGIHHQGDHHHHKHVPEAHEAAAAAPAKPAEHPHGILTVKHRGPKTLTLHVAADNTISIDEAFYVAALEAPGAPSLFPGVTIEGSATETTVARWLYIKLSASVITPHVE